MREQTVKLTKKLKVIPVLLALALAISMSGLAVASPSLQEGENQTGDVEQDTGQNNNQDQPDVSQDSNQSESQFQQPTAACAQQYTVQAGDSLSLIAQRFFDDLRSYNLIVEATNTVATGNNAFTPIDDQNVIEVGQILCIPVQPDQQQANMQQSQQQGQLQPTVQQQAGTQQQDDSLLVPQGMSMVFFENLSSRDLIVDISEGPTPQSLWVEPGTHQQFVVEPGQYVVMGHQPGGDFGVMPNRIDLTSGDLVGVVCNDTGQCQMQQGVQEISALRDQGQGMSQDTIQQPDQQQGTMQQQDQSGTMQQQDPSETPQQQNQPELTQPSQQNDDQLQDDQQSGR